MAFSTKIKGNHNLQGNVQLYNVRIPAKPAVCFSSVRNVQCCPEGNRTLGGRWLLVQPRPVPKSCIGPFKALKGAQGSFAE